MHDSKVCGDWMVCTGAVFKIIFGRSLMYLVLYSHHIHVIKSGIRTLLGLQRSSPIGQLLKLRTGPIPPSTFTPRIDPGSLPFFIQLSFYDISSSD